MSLVLNEEQRLLKDSARDFLAGNANIETFRDIRDNHSGKAYASDVWQSMVELGWSAVTIPEDYDGLGFGYVGLGQIFEEIGKQLAGSPLLNTVIATSIIELMGSEDQKKTLLPQLASGELNIAIAIDEGKKHSGIDNTQCYAKDGQLFGTKSIVTQAQQASKLIIVANNEQGGSQREAYLIDINASGLEKKDFRLLDGMPALHLNLDGVAIEQTFNSTSDNNQALEIVLDRARALLSAEMLGGCLAMFQRTMEYLKEREQFDVKIGTFQALKHRASQMFVKLELCKSCVLAALNAADQSSDDLAQLASLAKVQLNQAFILVTDEATQMHGGMGVTDELDVGLFLKRARIYQQLLGDNNYHQNRYAALNSY